MERKIRRTRKRLALLAPWLLFFAAVVMQQITLSQSGVWMKQMEVKLQEIEQVLEVNEGKDK